MRLAAQLTAQGAFPTTTGSGNRYPKSGRNCDLILRLPGDRRLWLETKIAWWTWPASAGAVNSGLCTKHLTSVTDNSAYRDITEKLPLVTNEADFVGELIIGFDSLEHPLDALVHRLVREAGVSGPDWMTFYSDWPNPQDSAYRVRTWLWCRAVGVLGASVAV